MIVEHIFIFKSSVYNHLRRKQAITLLTPPHKEIFNEQRFQLTNSTLFPNIDFPMGIESERVGTSWSLILFMNVLYIETSNYLKKKIQQYMLNLTSGQARERKD